MVATGLTDALSLSKKYATARSGSLAYIRRHPGSFEVARVRVKHPYSKGVLQAIQELIDQILRFSTSFVSESVRLPLVRVREQGVAALCMVLE
jgi:hypothetical protein